MIVDALIIIMSLLMGFVLLGIAAAICGTVFIISLCYTISRIEIILDWINEKIKKKND